jgi:hypothetical protein
VLAERAGLPSRALAEARRAVRALDRGRLVIPGQAAQVAVTAADIAAAVEPVAARQLKANVFVDDQYSRPSARPGLDVAAEVDGLERQCVLLPGLHWALDPALVAPGLFRPGLSPHSDLLVHYDSGACRLVVQATLAAGADGTAVSRCQAQIVDPGVRRVLARSGLERAGSRARARLQLSSPLEELSEAWLEVSEGPLRLVRSSTAHWIRRAVRWADAALRAERAPAGLAPRSTDADWAALAALAWERCRRDWAQAGDPIRASAVPESRVPLAGPAFLAEVLGE